MTTEERIPLIQSRLQKAFEPTFLEILNDSHLHAGHPGAKGGAGHYTVKISGSDFVGKSRLENHRLIYAVLQDLMPHEIHALKIVII